MSQPEEDRSEAETPEAADPAGEDPQDILRLSAADGARLISENTQLREALKEMAIERAELFNQAEGAGEAIKEAKALRDAARIDPAIAIFAQIMDEVAGEDPMVRDPSEMVKGIQAALRDMGVALTASSPNPVEFYRTAAILAVRGMRLADRESDRAKERRLARREALLKDR